MGHGVMRTLFPATTTQASPGSLFICQLECRQSGPRLSKKAPENFPPVTLALAATRSTGSRAPANSETRGDRCYQARRCDDRGPLWGFSSDSRVPEDVLALSMRRRVCCSSAVRVGALRGRPGGRRIRMKLARSSGKIPQTGPTLIPKSRCVASKRRT